MADQSQDRTAVWVYGKVEPGWYCARGIWNQAYADHLTSLGYRVERPITKPTSK